MPTITQWTEDVLDCVLSVGSSQFSLAQMYEYIPYLSAKYPNNNSVREQIRKQLQILRDNDLLRFEGKGNYTLLESPLKSVSADDLRHFKIQPTPPPNQPLYEFRETQKTFSSSGLRKRLRDKQIGDSGERAVMKFEADGLIAAGMTNLANKVEQVSVTIGDHAGYDVLSFHPSGKEKWIEVKTTTGGPKTKFHISEYQIEQSEKFSESYWLYRLYDFDLNGLTSSLFMVEGELRTKLRLQPVQYRASLR